MSTVTPWQKRKTSRIEFTFRSGPPVVDKDNRIIFYTTDGFVFYDEHEDSLQILERKQLLPGTSCNEICFDGKENIYINQIMGDCLWIYNVNTRKWDVSDVDIDVSGLDLRSTSTIVYNDKVYIFSRWNDEHLMYDVITTKWSRFTIKGAPGFEVVGHAASNSNALFVWNSENAVLYELSTTDWTIKSKYEMSLKPDIWFAVVLDDPFIWMFEKGRFGRIFCFNLNNRTWNESSIKMPKQHEIVNIYKDVVIVNNEIHVFEDNQGWMHHFVMKKEYILNGTWIPRNVSDPDHDEKEIKQNIQTQQRNQRKRGIEDDESNKPPSKRHKSNPSFNNNNINDNNYDEIAALKEQLKQRDAENAALKNQLKQIQIERDRLKEIVNENNDNYNAKSPVKLETKIIRDPLVFGIGISEYSNNAYGFGELPGAKIDLNTVISYFGNKYKIIYNKKPGINSTEFNDLIKECNDDLKINKRDAFIWFISGHGSMRYGEDNIVLSDGHLIKLDDLKSKFNSYDIPKIFVFDCCRENAKTKRKRNRNGDTNCNENKYKNIIIIYSNTAGSITGDWDNGGILIQTFLKVVNMKENKGLDIESIFKRTSITINKSYNLNVPEIECTLQYILHLS